MGPKTSISGRLWMVVGIVLAGLCLIRVLTVAAAEEDVEVYSASEHDDEGDSRGSDEDEGSAEIRLSRPDEAAGRIAYDSGHDLVPGADRLRAARKGDGTLLVPTRLDRKIAVDQQLPTSPVEAREAGSPTHVEQQAAHAGAAPQAAPDSAGTQVSATTPSPRAPASEPGYTPASAGPSTHLSSEPIEPRPFTAADARERAAEQRPEHIVTAHAASEKRTWGLSAERSPQPEIEPPVPHLPARSGVQEVSLIVSDYGYFPNRIFVTQSIPVKLYLTTPSKTTMCFMLDTLGLKKGVSPGKVEELQFTPESPGDYRFYCPVKSIEGRLTVREAPLASQSSRGLALAGEASGDASGEQGAERVEAPKRYNEPRNAAELRSLIED